MTPDLVTTDLATQDLVDGGGFFERTLFNDLRPHLLHEEHESVQRLLHV